MSQKNAFDYAIFIDYLYFQISPMWQRGHSKYAHFRLCVLGQVLHEKKGATPNSIQKGVLNSSLARFLLINFVWSISLKRLLAEVAWCYHATHIFGIAHASNLEGLSARRATAWHYTRNRHTYL